LEAGEGGARGEAGAVLFRANSRDESTELYSATESEADDEDDEDGSNELVHTVDADGNVHIILPRPREHGVDRLGFSPAEIRAIRGQFRAARGLPPIPRAVGDGDGSDEDVGSEFETEFETEEMWLNAASADDTNAQVAAAHAAERRVRPGVEGTNADFLFGCILGYLLGVLTLVLFLDKNISRRWRVGIVAGIATNAAFGVLRSSLVIGVSNLGA
jgi:hypothetical protein